jgi:hypothetical protein
LRIAYLCEYIDLSSNIKLRKLLMNKEEEMDSIISTQKLLMFIKIL